MRELRKGGDGMTWMITATGREHHLVGGGAAFNVLDIAEITHALSLINRFTGHTKRPYSVAEHSLLVAELAELDGASPVVQLAALMHDAHEAYTGDVSSPVKWAIGEPWDAFESTQAALVQRQFGLRTATMSSRAQIRHWDLVALATERRDLTAYLPGISAPWAILDTPGKEILPSTQHRLNTPGRGDWEMWRTRFTARFEQLRASVTAVHTNAQP